MRELDKENAGRPVRKGYLLVPAWALVRKCWSRKFCVLYDTSPQGVRRLELFDSEDQFEKGSGGKILVLEDAVKVQTMISRKDGAKDSNHAHHKDKDTAYSVFEITTTKRSVQLRAESLVDLQDWVDRIRKVAFPDKNQNIMHNNSSSNNNNNSNAQQSDNMNNSSNNNNNNNSSSKPNGYAVKENDLYGAVDDTFCVKLVSTPASEKCGLDPTELNYVIMLTADSMILKYGDLNNLYANDDQTDKTIFEWHYAYIRRYGIVSGFFSFEAGRKCASGEGLFSFDAPDVRKIFECLASYMKLAGEKRRQMKAAAGAPTPVGAGAPSTGPFTITDDAKSHGKSRLKAQLSGGSLDKDKVTHDENCEGCRQMSGSSSGSSTHENDPITFGRACAAPQTPVSSTAVYANISDPDPPVTSHLASTATKLHNGSGASLLLSSMSATPSNGGGAPVEHIVVGDGVEYARVVKTQPGPPPPPPAQKAMHPISIITRMESVETLEQGSC